jgi:outer membrane protein assembly factor BamD (BamD/ComL family)
MLGARIRRPVLAVAMLALLLAGCATVSSLTTSNEEKRFDAGMRALANGDYATAHKELAWVAERHANKSEGQRALLILAAMEMDPRNPARRTDVGADLAATFLRLPERDGWVDPVAQTMYLLGLELGAAEERAQRAERAAEAQQRELPKLPGPTVSARIKAIEQERDRLQARVLTLEEQLAGLQRELERIRKTIKP